MPSKGDDSSNTERIAPFIIFQLGLIRTPGGTLRVDRAYRAGLEITLEGRAERHPWLFSIGPDFAGANLSSKEFAIREAIDETICHLVVYSHRDTQKLFPNCAETVGSHRTFAASLRSELLGATGKS